MIKRVEQAGANNWFETNPCEAEPLVFYKLLKNIIAGLYLKAKT
jgi:hypothetical protein